MFKISRNLIKLKELSKISRNVLIRNFLSQAYSCNEVWEQRLNNPILQKIKLDEFYYDLDQKYQRTSKISAIDVDLFANNVIDDNHLDELLDLVHKLRLTEDSCNTLESTAHAVIRILINCDKTEELLNVVDDRLNYGIFLDYYTGNLLLDKFWKNKDYLSGTRVASQFMLQEDFNHSITSALSLLHCFKFLQNPVGWPEPIKPEEPEDEVKIRVKYLRNPYNDEHFDLRDVFKVVGKTIAYISKNKENALDKSFHIVGLKLFGKDQLVEELLGKVKKPLCKEVIDLLPDDKKLDLPTYSTNVDKELEERVKIAEKEVAEKDVSKQCEIFNNWEVERKAAIDAQILKLKTAKRLSDIEELQKELQKKEQKLWFFENEEQIDLDIDGKKIFYRKRWFGKKKKPRIIDTDYVPPEVGSQSKL